MSLVAKVKQTMEYTCIYIYILSLYVFICDSFKAGLDSNIIID